jgi:LmbE family N-acetylglucosaminyl deacetylase
VNEVAIGGVLGAFAHPDDEEFGTSGAIYSCIQRGIPARILCATSGDAGEISDPALATPENLGEVREGEMNRAAGILGLQPTQFLRYGDGKLPDLPPNQLRDDVVAAIRRYKPRVIVTFDANGGYGHPDHIAIHYATVAAFPLSRDPSFRPELGMPHAPDKLYFTAFPRSRFANVASLIEEYGVPGINFGTVQTIPTEEIGTADERITTIVPVEHFWDVRWAAFRAHQTQFGPNHPFMLLPESAMRQILSIDTLVRAVPPPAPGAALPDENDIWQGLPV